MKEMSEQRASVPEYGGSTNANDEIFKRVLDDQDFRTLLADVDGNKISKADLFAHAELMVRERIQATATAHKPAASAAPSANPSTAASLPAHASGTAR